MDLAPIAPRMADGAFFTRSCGSSGATVDQSAAPSAKTICI
jgi:hypothetical protein